MTKERAPIYTRTRNRNRLPTQSPLAIDELIEDNRERSVPAVSNHSTDNSVTFSPRDDPEIYLDELHTNLSFVRGTDDDNLDFLKEEHERIQRTFGKEYNATVKISTFYQAQVSPPVPSKRTRHRELNAASRNTSASLLTLNAPQTKGKLTSQMSSHHKGSRSKIKLSTQKQQPHSYIPSSDDMSPANTAVDHGLSDSTVSLDEEEKRAQVKTSFSSSKKANGSTFQSQLPSSNQINKRTTATAATRRVAKISDRIADEDYVPVPLSSLLPAELEAKDKEKEYWRRQRRVFVYSRFITNEEGLRIAQSVYGDTVTAINDRSVTSFQGNIANFRTKLRRIIDGFNDKFQVKKVEVVDDNGLLYQRLAELVTIPTLKVIWKHWIADPFVDVEEFYENQTAVDLLKDVTIKLIIIHFKEQFNIYTPRQARVQMRVLDTMTRTLHLPDATQYA